MKDEKMTIGDKFGAFALVVAIAVLGHLTIETYQLVTRDEPRKQIYSFQGRQYSTEEAMKLASKLDRWEYVRRIERMDAQIDLCESLGGEMFASTTDAIQRCVKDEYTYYYDDYDEPYFFRYEEIRL